MSKQKVSGLKDGSTQEIFDYVFEYLGLNHGIDSVFYGNEGKQTYVRINSDYLFPCDIARYERAGLKLTFVAAGITSKLLICLEVL